MKKPTAAAKKRSKDWAAFKAVVYANVIGKDEACFFPQNVDRYKAVAVRSGLREQHRQKLEAI